MARKRVVKSTTPEPIRLSTMLDDPDNASSLEIAIQTVFERNPNIRSTDEARALDVCKPTIGSALEEYNPPNPWGAIILTWFVPVVVALVIGLVALEKIGHLQDQINDLKMKPEASSFLLPERPLSFTPRIDPWGEGEPAGRATRVWEGGLSASTAATTAISEGHRVEMLSQVTCWISANGGKPYEGTVSGGSVLRLNFPIGGEMIVRSGCPGKIRYLLDGQMVHPENRAVNPQKVELVRLP